MGSVLPDTVCLSTTPGAVWIMCLVPTMSDTQIGQFAENGRAEKDFCDVNESAQPTDIVAALHVNLLLK